MIDALVWLTEQNRAIRDEAGNASFDTTPKTQTTATRRTAGVVASHAHPAISIRIAGIRTPVTTIVNELDGRSRDTKPVTAAPEAWLGTIPVCCAGAGVVGVPRAAPRHPQHLRSG